jgi:hypothetical protein
MIDLPKASEAELKTDIRSVLVKVILEFLTVTANTRTCSDCTKRKARDATRSIADSKMRCRQVVYVE